MTTNGNLPTLSATRATVSLVTYYYGIRPAETD